MPPTPSAWLEVTLTLPEAWAEAAGSMLREWGAPGYAEEAVGSGVRLTAHLRKPPREFARRLRTYLASVGEASGVPGPCSVRLVRRRDPGWARRWRDFHRVLRFGRLVVAPSWRAVRPKPGEVLLRLDPGMAFGTGQHPTTASCLHALTASVRPDLPVLDVGTGSGLLALAAAALGARPVFALDTDPLACVIAADNCRRNGLARAVRVCCGSLDALTPRTPFGLIVANLTAATHATLLPVLPTHLAPGGRAILAGLLAAQAPAIARAAEAAGLTAARRCRAGEWITLHLIRSA